MTSAKSLNCSLPEKASPLHLPIGHDGVMWFCVIAIPLVSLFGVIGNIFSFVILRSSATKISSHFFLVCLAIFDSISLFTFTYSFYSNLSLQPILLKFTDEVTFIERYFSSYVACPWRLYTSFTMRLVSIWTIVIFSLDRFLMVLMPMRSHQISTVRNAAIAIGCLLVCSVLFNIPWLFSYDKRILCNGRIGCRSNKILTIFRLIEFVFYSIIPSIIICFCNIGIVFILRQRQKHNTLYSKQAANSQEKMITIRLLLISTAFVVFTLPSMIIISIHTYDRLNKDNSYKTGIKADIFHLGMFGFVVNLSINFVLYCLTGKTFRKAAWNLLRCRWSMMQRYCRMIGPESNSQTPAVSNPTQRSSICSDKNRILTPTADMKPLITVTNCTGPSFVAESTLCSSTLDSSSPATRHCSDRPLLVTSL